MVIDGRVASIKSLRWKEGIGSLAQIGGLTLDREVGAKSW